VHLPVVVRRQVLANTNDASARVPSARASGSARRGWEAARGCAEREEIDMRTFKMAVLAMLVVLGLAACQVPPTTFEVTLSGDQEVPPVTTDAFGTANVTLIGNIITIDGAWDGFDIAAPGAHVHGPAPAGENAPILFPLDYDNEARTFGRTFTLSDEELGFFQDGLLYINLHSEAHPAGEIRGQIVR
jgi:hypothetical protein